MILSRDAAHSKTFFQKDDNKQLTMSNTVFVIIVMMGGLQDYNFQQFILLTSCSSGLQSIDADSIGYILHTKC